MRRAYNIKTRLFFCSMMCTAFFISAPAAFGGWVGETMCACPGLAKPLGNNATCEEACYGSQSPSGGGNSAPGYDYGAAERAREAEAELQRQAEAERIERERQAEIKRQKDAQFIRDRDAAANTLKGSSGTALDQLKGLTGIDNSGLKGSGFDTRGTGLKELRGSDNADRKARTQPAPHTDTSVVDARVPRDGAYLTDQVPELKQSPAADRITKGFQAVINHDWPLALAWWKDALQRDPNNAALKRLVDLAQWMVDRRKSKAAGPVTPLSAAIHSAARGDSTGAIRQFELAKSENPAIASQVDSMITELRERQVKEAKDAYVAEYWSRKIEKDMREIVDGLIETGMNRLIIGDDKGAQEAFDMADFFSGGLSSGEQSPSGLPKSGKSNSRMKDNKP